MARSEALCSREENRKARRVGEASGCRARRRIGREREREREKGRKREREGEERHVSVLRHASSLSLSLSHSLSNPRAYLDEAHLDPLAAKVNGERGDAGAVSCVRGRMRPAVRARRGAQKEREPLACSPSPSLALFHRPLRRFRCGSRDGAAGPAASVSACGDRAGPMQSAEKKTRRAPRAGRRPSALAGAHPRAAQRGPAWRLQQARIPGRAALRRSLRSERRADEG